MKSKELAEEAKRVFGEEVNITTEGQRHLIRAIPLETSLALQASSEQNSLAQ